MGARVYNSATGRFSSADAVAGGNENAYNYPNSPTSSRDLDGRAQTTSAWKLTYSKFGPRDRTCNGVTGAKEYQRTRTITSLLPSRYPGVKPYTKTVKITDYKVVMYLDSCDFNDIYLPIVSTVNGIIGAIIGTFITPVIASIVLGGVAAGFTAPVIKALCKTKGAGIYVWQIYLAGYWGIREGIGCGRQG
jgi:hypothetical protein